MKKGDKVQIKSRKWFEKQTHDNSGGCRLKNTSVYFNKEMYRFCDKIYTIIKIESYNKEKVYILNIPKEENIDIDYWTWTKPMFNSL